MSRTIFSTVRAPHEPALTVESLAITHTGRPSMRPDTGDDAVGGQVARDRVREQCVLDEGAVVEQQGQTVAHEQLVRRRELGAVLLEVAGERALGVLVDLVVAAHARRLHRGAAGSGAHHLSGQLTPDDVLREMGAVDQGCEIDPGR